MQRTITREELKEKRDRGDKLHLVNVLSAAAFAQAHIPGSEHVPVAEVEARAPALWEPGEVIVVYGGSLGSGASSRAAAALDKLGFVNVYDFKGGMADWEDGGYTVAYLREAA